MKHDLPTDILSEDELKVYRGFTNEQRKAEYLTARHTFWNLIEAAGWEPSNIKLQKEISGKPFITSTEGRRNVSFSHSSELVMCAISEYLDIGLDMEVLTRKVNPAILKRILNENELRLYQNDKPIALWTMKEAAVKSIGTGLRTNLNDLELQKNSNGSFIVKVKDQNELTGMYFEHLNHGISIAYS